MGRGAERTALRRERTCRGHGGNADGLAVFILEHQIVPIVGFQKLPQRRLIIKVLLICVRLQIAHEVLNFAEKLLPVVKPRGAIHTARLAAISPGGAHGTLQLPPKAAITTS